KLSYFHQPITAERRERKMTLPTAAAASETVRTAPLACSSAAAFLARSSLVTSRDNSSMAVLNISAAKTSPTHRHSMHASSQLTRSRTAVMRAAPAIGKCTAKLRSVRIAVQIPHSALPNFAGQERGTSVNLVRRPERKLVLKRASGDIAGTAGCSAAPKLRDSWQPDRPAAVCSASAAAYGAADTPSPAAGKYIFRASALRPLSILRSSARPRDPPATNASAPR